jgi:DNA-binding NarL/FixJ family response regulator
MLKVLIVDDSAAFRASLRDLLCQQLSQVLVVEAADGGEALEQVRRTAPDLAFIDIELGGESGLDLTRRIRGRHLEMPIAIITNYDLPEYRLAARDCGANSFFSKTSSIAEDILTWVASASPGIPIP